jgi:hypothetical protein
MPTRYLKESICSSDNLALLSAQAERFWFRLLVQCDDYGCFDARPTILRSRCFPLLLDSITVDDVAQWVLDLEKAGLIFLYAMGGKPYLVVLTFTEHNKPRAKVSKWPQPEEDDGTLLQVKAYAGRCLQMFADADNCEQVIADSSVIVYRNRNRISSANMPADAAATARLPLPDAEPEPDALPALGVGGTPAPQSRLGRKPKAVPPPPDPNLKNPAVLAYRAKFNLTPNKDQRAAIASVVTDLPKWDEALLYWSLRKWRTDNVPGMLDVYTNGPDAKRNGNGSTAPPAPKPEVIPPYQRIINAKRVAEAAEKKTQGVPGP